MNKERRRRIAQAAALIQRGRDLLEEILTDEEDAYESLSESLQYGERGQAMQDAIEGLQAALDELEGLPEQVAAIGEDA